uniref:Uncharacterized protein n=1 Tax=Arundo donax TaxID=35708 RepID=A0A0A9DB28_ARUDO
MMDMMKALERMWMSKMVTPAYMRLIVAMAEQKAARLLAMMNASKEYFLASTGVPPVLYPPGTWNAAANETDMMSTDTTPMVVVESLIFSASSFSSFISGTCSFSSHR